MPSTEGGQFPFNGQERQLGPEGCYTIRLGFYVFSIKTPKGGKNILMGPISKNEDSKLMQMLRPSSTIYLCGLLPLRPKAYNLLTQSYTYSTLFGAVHVAYCKSYCQSPLFQLGLSFPC